MDVISEEQTQGDWLMKDMFDKNIGLMIIFLLSLLFISPVFALILAVLLYRQKISFPLFIFFAFYFGWFYEPQLDLSVHYNHFKTLIGKSLSEAWVDDGTRHYGKEAYPVLFKYILGKVSDSANLFSGCAAAAYASAFSGMLYTIRKYYVRKLTPLEWAAFLGILFTVEYNWFLGFRFWIGAFIFMIFFIKYMETSQIKYVLLSTMACLFHFVHIILPLIILLDYVLGKSLKIRICFVLVSVICRYAEVNLFMLIPKFDFLRGYIKASSFNENIVASVNERMEEIRTYGNQVYLLRNEILFFSLVLVFLFLYKKDNNIVNYNRRYFDFILIFYGVVNFGYMDLIFYDREYKLLILMMFIYLLMYLSSTVGKLSNRLNVKLSLPLFLAVLYAILTIAVSQRMYLWKMDVWFNSFMI